MRSLALVVCVFLLTACTTSVEGRPTGGSGGGPRTAAGVLAALGDPATLDYCALTDEPAGYTAVASFDRCVVADGAATRMVGPLLAEEPRQAEPVPADGAPAGVRVLGQRFPDGCERYVALADDAYLAVGAHGMPAGDACSAADDVVAGVFTAVEGERVRHVERAPDSFGRLGACDLLDRPEVDRIAGRIGEGDRPRSVTRHHCEYARMSLRLDVGAPVGGRTEELGGREVAVERTEAYCQLVLTRPAPGDGALVERMWLTASYTGPVGGDVDCENVRTVGAAIVRELPR